MVNLPGELWCNIIEHVELKDLGTLANVDSSLRRFCAERLTRIFQKLQVRMAVRQDRKHLCVQLKFHSYHFESQTIVWEPYSGQDRQVQFDRSLLASSPLVRYLRISNDNKISSVALSRPITLPVRGTGNLSRGGHQKEAVIDYHVNLNGVRVNRMQTALSVFSYHPVPEDAAMHFPPASFTDWLRFQLREPEARRKENARFRHAVPWQPVMSSQHHPHHTTPLKLPHLLKSSFHSLLTSFKSNFTP